MALGKAIDLGNGVVTNFHSVASVIIDYENKLTHATVNLFVDAGFASAKGNTTIIQKAYTFADVPVSNPLDFVYGELKALPEFAGASDEAEPVKP